jgi:hypothetical protein
MLQTDFYHLPLRMNPRLANELISASICTGISRSEMCRMGLSRLLLDLKQTGRQTSMQEFRQHYCAIR